ncbi:MAG: Lrp/AsnC family transcriptional regulator [Muribaculaceae bacterium]|nr:Lrp/AsnC family transcriptional regulator [Muribaculaceae bacterium]MDE7369167.1 Lrp/AsnC family transcriptional regulator [Muribaculaceae bacterium]
MERLDSTDLKILKLLQENGRLTNKELASKVHLSITPVYERLRRLENEGYIKKYVALLDADKLNRGFVVLCNVKLTKINKDLAAEFTQCVLNIPEVTECYNISGSYDYLLRIHAPDMKYYQEFIINVLGSMSNIDSIESVFIMSVIKQSSSIPIDVE